MALALYIYHNRLLPLIGHALRVGVQPNDISNDLCRDKVRFRKYIAVLRRAINVFAFYEIPLAIQRTRDRSFQSYLAVRRLIERFFVSFLSRWALLCSFPCRLSPWGVKRSTIPVVVWEWSVAIRANHSKIMTYETSFMTWLSSSLRKTSVPSLRAEICSPCDRKARNSSATISRARPFEPPRNIERWFVKIRQYDVAYLHGPPSIPTIVDENLC